MYSLTWPTRAAHAMQHARERVVARGATHEETGRDGEIPCALMFLQNSPRTSPE